jgi:predicted DNA binding CopG/RHH family protein
MREEYDFSKGEKNPYAKKLKQQITINIDSSIVDYFKKMSASSGIPYQTLINLYLSDCMTNNRKIDISWQ